MSVTLFSEVDHVGNPTLRERSLQKGWTVAERMCGAGFREDFPLSPKSSWMVCQFIDVDPHMSWDALRQMVHETAERRARILVRS